MRAKGGGACVSGKMQSGHEGGGSHGMVGGRAAAVGCSIGAVAPSRRMSQVVGALWVVVVGVGSRGYAVMGGLFLDARVRVLIGIGEASCTILFRCCWSKRRPALAVRNRAVKILKPHVQSRPR
jgi:hypothetical protein